MALISISGPTVEPVTLAEARLHRLIDSDEQDTLITSLIKASREKLERETGRAFVDQTWELQIPAFEQSIEIPLPPLIEVLSVKYLDGDEEEQPVATSVYRTVAGGIWNGFVRLKVNQSWPTDVAICDDAVRIRFRAGWPYDEEASPVDKAGNVPELIRTAIKMTVGNYFEIREDVVTTDNRQTVVQIPDGIMSMLSTLIVPRL